MSIGNVSSSSIWPQMQQFSSGKTKLQKADLEVMQQETTQSQSKAQAANPFGALLEMFDEIDQDKDGISIDELKNFVAKNSKAEPEKSMGVPPSMTLELRFVNTANGSGQQTGETDGITKDQLLEVKKQMEAQGMKVPSQLNQMISDFATFDANQDGKVGLEELMNAQKETESAKTDDPQANKQQLLETIKKFADSLSKNANSVSASGSTTTEPPTADQDMAIKFMRALKQYSNFSTNVSQDSLDPSLKIAA